MKRPLATDSKIIYDINGDTIRISSEELWSHTAVIKGYVPNLSGDTMILNALELRPHGSVDLISLSICFFQWGYLRVLMRHRQNEAYALTNFWIYEVLTKGGVFLRDQEDILLWLLNERTHTMGDWAR